MGDINIKFINKDNKSKENNSKDNNSKDNNSKDNNKNIIKNNMQIFFNNYIFPCKLINEDNIYQIGFIDQTNILFVQYNSIETQKPDVIGYFYHVKDKDIYYNVLNSNNKPKFIKTNLNKYPYHIEFIFNQT